MENLSDLLKNYSQEGLEKTFEDMSFLEEKLDEFEKEYETGESSPVIEGKKQSDWLEKFLSESEESEVCEVKPKTADMSDELKEEDIMLDVRQPTLVIKFDDLKKGRDLDTFYHLKRVFDHIGHESGVTVIGKPDWIGRTIGVQVFCHHLNYSKGMTSRPSDEYECPPPPPPEVLQSLIPSEEPELDPNQDEKKKDNNPEFLIIPNKPGKNGGKEFKIKLDGFLPKSAEEVRFWLKKNGMLSRISIYGEIGKWKTQ
ncbi:phosphoprotein [Curionopolis virus]|uniref:Phosphoprotein n=2 Tax=Curionopolis virus TaxID=490110 RepID=A0A0D3R183_9RHAB|nr:phosphoprotein [Curionopolis virus]AIE12113.1 P protein [Curionopolis virus]AJR28366.1 phosphoprotein [Curionopolis virus]